MLAKIEEHMRGMLRRFRQYLEKNRLVPNALKLKIIVFKKGGRGKDYLWKWEEKTLQTAKEWKYLGMWPRSSGAITGHIYQIKRRQ